MRTLKERHCLLGLYGWSQGSSSGSAECAGCGNEHLAPRAQWWRCRSYGYDEWECRCRKCALDDVLLYEGSDGLIYLKKHEDAYIASFNLPVPAEYVKFVEAIFTVMALRLGIPMNIAAGHSNYSGYPG